MKRVSIIVLLVFLLTFTGCINVVTSTPKQSQANPMTPEQINEFDTAFSAFIKDKELAINGLRTMTYKHPNYLKWIFYGAKGGNTKLETIKKMESNPYSTNLDHAYTFSHFEGGNGTFISGAFYIKLNSLRGGSKIGTIRFKYKEKDFEIKFDQCTITPNGVESGSYKCTLNGISKYYDINTK